MKKGFQQCGTAHRQDTHKQSDASDCAGMPDDLHRLIYTSEASAPGESYASGGLPPMNPQNIATLAARRNSNIGVSGVLIVVRDHFIQILEGMPDALERVFESICCDMRHRRLKLIDFSPASERAFAGWGMVALDANLVSDPEPFEDLFMSIRSGMAPATIVTEVRHFLNHIEHPKE